MKPTYDYFQNKLKKWKIAYFADVSSNLNDFNVSLQLKQITLSNCYIKVEVLINKSLSYLLLTMSYLINKCFAHNYTKSFQGIKRITSAVLWML